MREKLAYKIMSFKYHIHKNYDEASGFLKRNWMKLVVIGFAFQVLWSKNIRFSVDLSHARAGIYQNDMSSSQPHDTEAESIIETGHAEPSIPQSANTFSNLGFLLNPSYSKKKKVASRIVDHHNNKCQDYIKAYHKLAQKEMQSYGIPASIKLAQALLESNAGESKLAVRNNNHFGIKCFSKKCTKGHCSNFSDDTHKDFFRNYESVAQSFRAHSIFLQKDRYIHLQNLKKTDYKAWARGLKEAGYATDPNYANKLIGIIESMKLYQYDQ